MLRGERVANTDIGGYFTDRAFLIHHLAEYFEADRAGKALEQMTCLFGAFVELCNALGVHGQVLLV